MNEALQIGRDIALALLGGVVGSFGGALGAQRIVERTAQRKDLLMELRNTNALIQLCFSACNSALQFRSQFSRDLLNELKADQEAFRYMLKGNIKLHPGDELYLHLNFQRFPPPVIPIGAIQEILHSRVSVVGRTLAAASELMSAAERLTNTVLERDAILEKFVDESIPKAEAKWVYLGIRPAKDGVTDQRYPDIVESIDFYASHIAFFSHILCGDLMEHAGKVRGELLKNFKRLRGIPEVSRVSFEGPLKLGLLPPDSDFEKWLRGFQIVGRSSEL